MKNISRALSITLLSPFIAVPFLVGFIVGAIKDAYSVGEWGAKHMLGK